MNYSRQNYPDAAASSENAAAGIRHIRRWRIFLLVFLPCIVVSQSYIFLQPAIYRSVATVLTTAETDVDQASIPADAQHVSIQKQILLGNTVLEKTRQHLQDMLTNTHDWQVDELRNLFAVVAEPNTNLLHLQAEGPDPKLLQRAVNAWIDSYIRLRSAFIAENTGKVTAELNDQLGRVETQLADKRTEIDQFRLQHDILSTESADNQVHARLQGLNKSLNTALEEEVKAKAKLDTLSDAVSRQELVIPESDTRAMAVLLTQAEKLRGELAAIEAQYTREYIELNPNLRRVREQLAEIEAKIAEKASVGKGIAIQEAQNNYAAARQAVSAIKQQMLAHKQLAADYTAQFDRHQALQQELLKLETLQQETKQRLVDIEVKQRENYPQVDVVDWATLPEKPVRPNYLQQALLAFAASLGLALLAVVVIDYLSRETTITPSPALMTLRDIHLHHQPQPLLDSGPQAAGVVYEPLQALSADVAGKELSQEEVFALWQAADPLLKAIIALLFNGLSLAEILSLTPDSLDRQLLMIIVPQQRNVVMNASVAGCIGEDFKWSGWPSEDQVESMLCCTAIDCGLPGAASINSETLRYTYLLFLARQNIKLADLTKIAGALAPDKLVELGHYATGDTKVRLAEIRLDYFQLL